MYNTTFAGSLQCSHTGRGRKKKDTEQSNVLVDPLSMLNFKPIPDGREVAHLRDNDGVWTFILRLNTSPDFIPTYWYAEFAYQVPDEESDKREHGRGMWDAQYNSHTYSYVFPTLHYIEREVEEYEVRMHIVRAGLVKLPETHIPMPATMDELVEVVSDFLFDDR